MADLLEKFGLEWIDRGAALYRARKQASGSLGMISGSASQAPASLMDVAGEALVTALKQQPHHEAKLKEILPKLGLRLDWALPIVHQLIANGRVELVQDDPADANFLLRAK